MRPQYDPALGIGNVRPNKDIEKNNNGRWYLKLTVYGEPK